MQLGENKLSQHHSNRMNMKTAVIMIKYLALPAENLKIRFINKKKELKDEEITVFIGMLTIVFIVSPVFGQDLYFGMTGGLNRADMNILGDGEEQKVNSQSLWGTGGLIGIKLNNRFSLQIRPLYLKKGGILDLEPPSVDIEFKMAFDLSVKAVFGKKFRPYILAGPSIGFLTKSEAKAKASGNILKADLKKISRKTEYSLGIGGGFELPLWRGYLFVEERYLFGLNNLNKGGTVIFKLDDVVANTEDIEEEDAYKNRGIQIMAGYTIPLEKQ